MAKLTQVSLNHPLKTAASFTFFSGLQRWNEEESQRNPSSEEERSQRLELSGEWALSDSHTDWLLHSNIRGCVIQKQTILFRSAPYPLIASQSSTFTGLEAGPSLLTLRPWNADHNESKDAHSPKLRASFAGYRSLSAKLPFHAVLFTSCSRITSNSSGEKALFRRHGNARAFGKLQILVCRTSGSTKVDPAVQHKRRRRGSYQFFPVVVANPWSSEAREHHSINYFCTLAFKVSKGGGVFLGR